MIELNAITTLLNGKPKKKDNLLLDASKSQDTVYFSANLLRGVSHYP